MLEGKVLELVNGELDKCKAQVFFKETLLETYNTMTVNGAEAEQLTQAKTALTSELNILKKYIDILVKRINS